MKPLYFKNLGSAKNVFFFWEDRIHNPCFPFVLLSSMHAFNAKYVPIVEEIAKEKGVQFKSIRLQSKEQAQNAPTPITTYALFYNGEYLTNEQMNDKKFLKLLAK